MGSPSPSAESRADRMDWLGLLGDMEITDCDRADIIRHEIRAAEAAARREGKLEGLREARDVACDFCRAGWAFIDSHYHCTNAGPAVSCSAEDIRALIAAEEAEGGA